MNENEKPAMPSHAERADEFAKLFSCHARQIYSYILTLVPHWADADDIFQETSAIIWEKFADFKPDSNFLAWACQVAYYRAVWFHQRRKRAAITFSEDFLRLIAEETVSQQESEALEARHLALADCIRQLPPVDRELLERCYLPGVTIKQAALELGRSPDAAYKALKRIHRQLFDCVEASLKNRKD